MELKLYLDSRNIEYQEFAAWLGISTRTLFNYMSGRYECPLGIAKKIEVLTKNKVTMEDMLKTYEEKKRFS